MTPTDALKWLKDHRVQASVRDGMIVLSDPPSGVKIQSGLTEALKKYDGDLEAITAINGARIAARAEAEADNSTDTDTAPKGYAEYLAGRTDLWDIMQHGIPPTRWLVPDLLPATGVTAIFGREGSGKTWLLLHAAIHAARQGQRVMVIDEEAGRPRTAKRLITMGATRDEVNLIDHFPYRTGGTLADFAAIIQYHVRTQNVALVGIDSVSKMLSAFGLKENDPGENTDLAAALFTPIASVLGRAVLLLDHTPHGGDRPRGASSKNADYDLAWYAEVTQEGNPAERGEIQLTRKKDRDGTEAPGYVRFAYGGDGPARDFVQCLGAGKSEAANMTVRQEAKQEAAVQTIIALYGESNTGMTYAAWKRAIRERTGKSENTCERYISELSRAEDAEQHDGLYFVTAQGYERYTPYLVRNRP